MSASYEISEKPLPFKGSGRPAVLITGSGGRIGSSLAEYAGDRYRLRLHVREETDSESMSRFGEVVAGDLTDPDAARTAVQDIDTVVHLAADPSASADWDSLLPNNIIALYHVVSAAVEAGCRRIVLASSIHAVSGYPPGYQVHAHDPVNPGDLYGVSKCFAEALGRYVAVQKGLSAIVLRIGAFQPRERAKQPERMGMMNAFVSHRDLNQLIVRCIDDTRLLFAIFHALSANRFNRMDIGTARELVGYCPQDDFLRLNEELARLHVSERVQPHDDRHSGD